MDVLIEPDETARLFREYVIDHPDIVYDEYQHDTLSLNGACYVLAESYFHAKGGTDSGFTIHCLSWSEVGGSGTHWFLKDADTVIDLGLDRLEQAENVPYDVATRRAFITGYEPSKRSCHVLENVDFP